MSDAGDLDQLLTLSARAGRDPLLTQASSGNTSIKLNGTLWIKASGTWLANAADGAALVPVALNDLRTRLRNATEFTGAGAWVNGRYRRASVETAMHAILPHRVVIHVHSINTLAWAVRCDGPARLRERLEGLNWTWVPYVPSGLPLARAIELAISEQPGTRIFVLANHGLVVCGASCEEAEKVLQEVEMRVQSPIRPNPSPPCEASLRPLVDDTWRLPDFPALHQFGTDPVSSRIAVRGTLFPCQAIFLGNSAFRILENLGILVSRHFTASQQCVLNGLFEVVRRIPEDAPIRYLTDAEVADLLTEDAHNYHLSTENNAPPELQRLNRTAEPISEIATR